MINYMCIYNKTAVENGSYCIVIITSMHFTVYFSSFPFSAASSDYVFYDNDQGRTKWEVHTSSHLGEPFAKKGNLLE